MTWLPNTIEQNAKTTIFGIAAKAVINPPPKEHLRELLKADISLQSDGFSGLSIVHIFSSL